MQRGVNDYNIVKKIGLGYRPALPLEIKDVGSGTQAMKMEMTDADYKHKEHLKQVENDLHSPGEGIDLIKYKKDIKAEAISFIIRKITKRELFGMSMRKIFGRDLRKYMDKILIRKG